MKNHLPKLFSTFLAMLAFMYSSNCFAQTTTNVPCNNAISIPAGPPTTFIPVFGAAGLVETKLSAQCLNFLGGKSVWYKLNPSANYDMMRIRNTGFQEDIVVSLYSGDCDDLSLIQCGRLALVTGGLSYGDVLMSNNRMGTQSFYLKVNIQPNASESGAIQVDFINGNTTCVLDTYSKVEIKNASMGSSLEGPFQPGEEVEACFVVSWAGGNYEQKLHGLAPFFGDGWQPTFYQPNLPIKYANQAVFNDLMWRNSGITYNFDGTKANTNSIIPPGWFALERLPNPIDPNNQGCDGNDYLQDANCSAGYSTFTYRLCVDLQVKDQIDCSANPKDQDLTLGFYPFSDGETGANTGGSFCEAEGPYIKNYTAACCDQLALQTFTPPDYLLSGDLLPISITEFLPPGSTPSDYVMTWDVRSTDTSTIDNIYDCYENCGDVLNILADYTGCFPIRLNYKIQIHDLSGCYVGAQNFDIEVRSTDVFISVSSSANGMTLCPNEFPTTLTATWPACADIFEYYWQGPNGSMDYQDFIVANEPGVYQFGYFTNYGGVFTEDFEVFSLPVVNIDFDIPSVICFSNDPQDILNATPVGGTFVGQNVVNGMFLANQPGIYEVTYQYTDMYGCAQDATTTIEVVTSPNVFVEHPNFVCRSNDLLDVLIPFPPDGTFDPSPAIENRMVNASVPGSYPVTYRYGDPNSLCNGSSTFILNIVDGPIVDIVAPVLTTCLFDEPIIPITVSPLGGNFISGNVDQDNLFTPNQLGSNSIIYEYENQSTGCFDSKEIVIEVEDALDITIAQHPAVFCPDDGPYTFLASPSGGTFNIPNGVFDPAPYFDESVDLSYSVTDLNCPGSEDFTIYIGVDIAATVDHPNEICITNGPVQVTPSINGGVYTGAISQDGIFSPTATGIYDFTYEVTHLSSCSTPYNFSIVVSGQTQSVINLPAASYCLDMDNQVQLTATPPGGFFIGDNVTTEGIFTPATEGISIIEYFLGPNQCATSSTVEIEVFPSLGLVVDHPETLCRTSIPYDVLIPNISGGTWQGPVTADGRFEAFVLGLNTVSYTVADPINSCVETYSFEIDVVLENDLGLPQWLTPVQEEYCIYEIVELCIDPVFGAVDYRWGSNHAIIENSDPQHLCIRIAWNALVQDQVCVTPIGDCGASNETLCLDVNIIDDVSCIIISTGTEDLTESNFTIWPNPTTNNFNIKGEEKVEEITVYNALGQIVWAQDKISTSNYSLPFGQQTPGIYFVQINGEHLEKVMLIE